MQQSLRKKSFDTYPSYKDSGVDWLGKIPEGWEVKPLFSEVKLRSEDNHIDEELLSVYLEKGVIRFKDVVAKRTNVTSTDLSKYQLVKIGDFVLNNQQAWRGSVGVSKYRGIVSPAYLVLEISKKLDKNFANYMFRNQHMVSQYLKSSKGVGTIQRNLYYPQLKRSNVLLPSPPEQTAIANFLDEKTTKIDQAIAQKEKMIALLKERKQILIQNAVTKGLDPNVKMKDSGVEWIGEIPEHWEVFQLKRLIDPSRKITYGIVQPGNPDPNGRFMIRGQDYSKGWADQSTLFKVSPRIEMPYKRARVIKGDLIITIVGAGCGNMEIIPEWLDGANLTQTTARLAINQKEYNSKYVYYVMKSDVGNNNVLIHMKGAAQPGLNLSHIKTYPVPIPSSKEQDEIAVFLDQKLKKFDDAEMNQQTQIKKLKEYKATLIDSAVTGKIKVG